MVDVGMGEQHRVDRADGERQVVPISTGKLPFLKHAEVDQDPRVRCLKAISRPGNLPVGAQKMEFHSRSSSN
jgi:hypothetical protein